ncbi:MAG: ribonuclease H [Bdellovibrionota bacterium]
MKFFLTAIYRRLLNNVRNSSTLEIYTDGSSKGGVGSWAYVISQNGKCIVENSGRIRRANSNSMEFQAAIEALSFVPENSNVTLFSDSRILVNAMKYGEPLSAHQPQIDTLMGFNDKHTIKWQWVKAHNGNKLNERCDELCTLARNSRPIETSAKNTLLKKEQFSVSLT